MKGSWARISKILYTSVCEVFLFVGSFQVMFTTGVQHTIG